MNKYILIFKHYGSARIVIGWTDNPYIIKEIIKNMNSSNKDSMSIEEYHCTRIQFENMLFVTFNIMPNDIKHFECKILSTHDNVRVITSPAIFEEAAYETDVVDARLIEGINSVCKLLVVSDYINSDMRTFLLYFLKNYCVDVYNHMHNDQLSFVHFNNGKVDIIKLLDQEGLLNI